ncbi:toprim domain-containing protein [Asanoa sp. WMMD1127]|uniref:toprim domain-containing protein n=1 Tax=Asanoa sp. WMMD1127 TaxID=3016107 RepID=UPI0024173709|nr:toprim domain-containing protein [Asanoa sp. WMMD1127]MDG4825984.1 toprim domain-containing protein [Asanoa sp. WMMD1127]
MQEISLVVSNSWKTFLGEATETYHKALMANPASPAVEYLKETRGLSGANAQFFKLGLVESPLPGHEQYEGKLAIPYLTRSGVVSMRFRAIPPGDATGPKYLSVPGDIPRLFNPADLDRREHFVCICEGEFDAMTAHQAGLPAVGIPGVNGWKEYYSHCFKGYENVFILADNDDKGQGETFAEKVASQVANARIVLMPSGHDVNSFVLAEGPDALTKRLEVKSA